MVAVGQMSPDGSDSTMQARTAAVPAPCGAGAHDSTACGSNHRRTSVLWLSTIAFTLMFAVWLMFGILGIPIRKELSLDDLHLSWIAAIAILNGSMWRLPAGIITDRFGGRKIMAIMLLLTAIPCFGVAYVHSYGLLLLLAFLVGFAGNSFSVGVAWTSVWFPKESQGAALGVFGAGNVGASVTKLIGPSLIAAVPAAGLLGGVVPGAWRAVPFVYGVLLIIMALVIWFAAPTPDQTPGHGRHLRDMLRPLSSMRVWRFGLYYVVFFGAYVALSAWLPKYYVDVYHLQLSSAALLTALFIFPASLLRPLGGWMSDRFGARGTTYLSFLLMIVALVMASIPQLPIGPGFFTVLMVLVGVAMGVGKASVYRYIPDYFPKDVGAVGGLVGMLGGLGGFFLPPLFAWARTVFGFPQTTFLVVLVISLVSMAWLHLTVISMRRYPPEVAVDPSPI